MRLTNREKVLLPAALLIIMVALFINFIYLPLDKEINRLKLQSDHLTNQVFDAETKKEVINQLEEQFSIAKEDFIKEHGDVLPVWDQPELLVFIENTIDSLCEKTSIDFYDVVSVDTVQAGDITIELKTNYMDLKNIFKKFEEADYYNSITHINVTETDESALEAADDRKKLEVSMNIRFYASNLTGGYPEDYEFMDGDYGKKNIFE